MVTSRGIVKIAGINLVTSFWHKKWILSNLPKSRWTKTFYRPELIFLWNRFFIVSQFWYLGQFLADFKSSLCRNPFLISLDRLIWNERYCILLFELHNTICQIGSEFCKVSRFEVWSSSPKFFDKFKIYLHVILLPLD